MKPGFDMRAIAAEAAVLEAHAEQLDRRAAQLKGDASRLRCAASRLWQITGAGKDDRAKITHACGYAALAVAEQGTGLEIGSRIATALAKLAPACVRR